MGLARIRANIFYHISFFAALVASAAALYFEPGALELFFSYSAASAILLLGGIRLFIIVAFGLRGTLAVALCIFVLLFQLENKFTWPALLALAALWAAVPYAVALMLESVLRLRQNLQYLGRNHLMLFAVADSVAIFALLLLSLVVTKQDIPSSVAASALGGSTNLLSIVVMIVVVHVFMRVFRRLSRE